MPRPRVRRKINNPSSKVSRKQKNPYKVSFAGAHPLIQKHWDKTKTLKQNYEHLGLCPQLNGYAGGQGEEQNHKYQETLTSLSDKLSQPIEWRDMSTEEDHQTNKAEAMEEQGISQEVEPPKFIDDRILSIGSQVSMKKIRHMKMSHAKESQSKMIEEIENQVKESIKMIRAPSTHEEVILSALEQKYGTDYNAMAKDLKLNKYQLTCGQLKKRFARFLLKKAGITGIKFN